MFEFLPYEIPPIAGLDTTGGTTKCFEIDFPSQSFIDKIVISQTAGAAVSFTAAFYNRTGACAGQDASESLAGDDIDLVPPDNFRVTPDLAGVSGRFMYFAADKGGLGYQFYNQDDRDPTIAPGINQRKIYLKLTTTGSGAQEFAVTLGCMAR